MIDLKPFCGTDESRPYLMQPWSRDGFTYATNGHICVRVPAIDGIEDCEAAPNAGKLFAVPLTSELVSVTTLSLPPERRAECSGCEGRGVKHRCPDCACVCEKCSGTKEVGGEDRVSVGLNGFNIGLRYLRLIVSLPGAKVQTIGEPGGAVAFAFDGGDGRLMALRGNYSDHHGKVTP
jgi:hypothetical protein